MQITRSLIAVTLDALFTTGCSRGRQWRLLSELRNENARLTQELNALQEIARDLETERNYLQEENVRLRAQPGQRFQQIERQDISTAGLPREFKANPETGGVSTRPKHLL